MSGAEVSGGVAVVTGGGSGFGRALAERCADRGFDVALVDIDGERAAAEAVDIADQHQVRAIGVRCDVSDSSDVEHAAAAVAKQLGGADLVISNVGVQQIGKFEEFPDDAWTWMLDVNVVGTARVARAFLPLLRRSDQARLAFTASSSVLDPAIHLAAYQATKFAVFGLAETLRLELVGDGIGVSVIFPSGMMTRHLESSLAARPDSIAGEIAPARDIEAMLASNEAFVRDVATAEDAASHVVEDILAAEPYIITHGDLVDAVAMRHTPIQKAAERAHSRDHGRG